MGENEIRNLADSHAGIDEWKKAGFNELQVLEITKGNDNGVDISIYASPEYNSRQMKVIRMALEEGIDVSAMADPEYNYMQMEQIKEGIKEGISFITAYAIKDYTCFHMIIINIDNYFFGI